MLPEKQWVFAPLFWEPIIYSDVKPLGRAFSTLFSAVWMT